MLTSTIIIIITIYSRRPQFSICSAESLLYIWSSVLTVLAYLQCLIYLSRSPPSRVCAGRPLHPPEPLPQHHLQLQLAAAVSPAGLHLRPLPHSGLVPVSHFWQAGQHAHSVCGGECSLFVKRGWNISVFVCFSTFIVNYVYFTSQLTILQIHKSKHVFDLFFTLGLHSFDYIMKIYFN